jgi:hypothetical protein
MHRKAETKKVSPLGRARYRWFISFSTILALTILNIQGYPGKGRTHFHSDMETKRCGSNLGTVEN